MDLATLIAVRLAKEGFGTARELMEQPTDLVLAQFHYSNFCSDYERAALELAKENQ